jgi:flagellar biosynthetic protein FliR
MLEEILQLNIFAFLLVFARIGTAFFLLPGISSMQVPMRSRLSLALAVSFVVTPALVAQMPPPPGAPMMIFALVGSEMLAGAILGTVPMILMSAVHVAGTIISFVSSLANALTFDPVVQQQSAIVSGFLATTAVLLMFITDLHHVFIRAIIDSYALFRPGLPPDMGDVVQLIARHVADTFLVGVQISAPFIIVGFAYNVGLGILSRLAPQVPLFFVGMPLQLVISIIVLMIAVSGTMLAVLSHTAEGMRPFLRP